MHLALASAVRPRNAEAARGTQHISEASRIAWKIKRLACFTRVCLALLFAFAMSRSHTENGWVSTILYSVQPTYRKKQMYLCGYRQYSRLQHSRWAKLNKSRSIAPTTRWKMFYFRVGGRMLRAPGATRTTAESGERKGWSVGFAEENV